VAAEEASASARSNESTGVLFICMGNICRSPTAEGVFRHHVQTAGLRRSVVVASAGTHDYHVGKPPDARAQAAARRRGYDLSRQRARAVSAADFRRYDYILCMDRSNLAAVSALQPGDFGGYLGLFLDFAPWVDEREVPDPYYGGPAGFERVLDLIEEGSRSLIAEILARRHP
jgi:protein-tyrosine phosphatase